MLVRAAYCVDIAEGREIYYLIRGPDGRESYSTRPMTIVTGVPRRGRDAPDPDPPAQVCKASKPDTENPRRPHGQALRLPEGEPLRATGTPPAPEPAPSEPIPILVQIRAPDERDVAGVIARGYCRHTDTKVRVYDTEGQLLGTDTLRPGDNVEVAAKKLLRDSAGGFYGRINYSRSSLH
jgi:hypothetical protein